MDGFIGNCVNLLFGWVNDWAQDLGPVPGSTRTQLPPNVSTNLPVNPSIHLYTVHWMFCIVRWMMVFVPSRWPQDRFTNGFKHKSWTKQTMSTSATWHKTMRRMLHVWVEWVWCVVSHLYLLRLCLAIGCGGSGWPNTSMCKAIDFLHGWRLCANCLWTLWPESWAVLDTVSLYTMCEEQKLGWGD